MEFATAIDEANIGKLVQVFNPWRGFEAAILLGFQVRKPCTVHVVDVIVQRLRLPRSKQAPRTQVIGREHVTIITDDAEGLDDGVNTSKPRIVRSQLRGMIGEAN